MFDGKIHQSNETYVADTDVILNSPLRTSYGLPVNLSYWLHALPCVVSGSVTIDVRGVWPVAITGLKARQIESRDDMIWFVTECL